MAEEDFLIQNPPKRRRWLPRLWGSSPGNSTLGGSGRSRLRRLLKWTVGIVLAILLLYYPLGALWVHEIDDDLMFTPGEVAPGASRAVAMAAALIDREAGQHEWPANDPWFLPGAVLDNMPNYQIGIVTSVRRFAQEMTDQIGRARGSSQADPDLTAALSRLNYDPTVWFVDFRVSAVGVTTSSERQYLGGRDSLLSYNRRLAAGQAVFDRRSDNLLSTLDRIAKDLGSASATIEREVESGSGALLDFQADDIFYRTKGQLYAYALILQELGVDYESLIKERNLTAVWQEMLDSLRQGARLQPWVVLNGAPDSQLLPSHLAGQGLFLLRARSQIFEIADILLK